MWRSEPKTTLRKPRASAASLLFVGLADLSETLGLHNNVPSPFQGQHNWWDKLPSARHHLVKVTSQHHHTGAHCVLALEIVKDTIKPFGNHGIHYCVDKASGCSHGLSAHQKCLQWLGKSFNSFARNYREMPDGEHILTSHTEVEWTCEQTNE